MCSYFPVSVYKPTLNKVSCILYLVGPVIHVRLRHDSCSPFCKWGRVVWLIFVIVALQKGTYRIPGKGHNSYMMGLLPLWRQDPQAGNSSHITSEQKHLNVMFIQSLGIHFKKSTVNSPPVS